MAKLQQRVILDSGIFSLTLERLAHQLIENHQDFSNTVFIGVQPRGIFLAERLTQVLAKILPKVSIPCGKLDVTFYRDDFRRTEKPLTPNHTEIDFLIEDKNVVLIDDVFYTGRTIRSAMDAMIDFGRPAKVELLVLIDRRFSRQLPVQPDYIGKTVDAITSERVLVQWKEADKEDKVWIMSPEESKK